MAHDGHVVRAVALAQARLVVGKHHIEHPMQAVLNEPVPAHAVRGARGGERRGRDVVAVLYPPAVPTHLTRSRHAKTGCDGPYALARATLVSRRSTLQP